MDFSQQLHACVEQANDALRRFLAPLPFQNTPLVEAMQYGALLGGKRLRPFLVYATGECSASAGQRWTHRPPPSNASMLTL
jgi:farnesyl diphosphate synthase